MRVVYDAGLLARMLGEGAGGVVGPAELGGLVVPVLDITPFLLAGEAPAGESGGDSFTLVGGGRLRLITFPNPAPGVDYDMQVPAGVAWHVIAFFAQYVASAVVGSRHPRLVLRDPSDVSTIFIPPVHGVVVSQTGLFLWAQGVDGRNAVGGLLEFATSVPQNFIGGPGWRFRTITNGISAADQWSIGKLYVREYSA